MTLALALAFSSASRAGAQETPSDDPAPVSLNEGEPAPYAGDLWPIRRSIRLALRAQRCGERSALDLLHATSQFRIKLEHQESLAGIQADTDAQRIAILERALEDSNPWYWSPLFVALVTAAATLAAVTVSAVVLDAATAPW